MAPTSSRPKITSSSFGLSTTGERLGGKKKTIKISSLEKSSLKNLVSINNILESILNTLTGAQKEDKKLIDKQRKEEESKKRSERERGLESKVFDGIKTAVSTVMKPFTSIWDWITNFFFNVFLGKVVIKLLDWFSDPKNKDKIQSIVRFFQDWWPTMLGAYLLFGTSFGSLARGLVGIAGKAVIGLGKVLARLILSVTKGKALKAAGALSGGGGVPGRGGGGWKGALGKGALAIGGSLLAGFAIDKGVEALTGGGEEESLTDGGEEQQAKIDVPDSPEIPMLNAATGGLADIGKIFSKFGGNMMGGAMGSMFGPLGMLMGSMMGGNLPNIFQGLVKGKKGTDKIPAMLTDGEFVMSKGAVAKYGVDTLESMNAAGGGTNIPKIVKGVPHAAGGGQISSSPNSAGGKSNSPDFWKMVAISAREDMRHPQGQADVAQSIYNRISLGSYPGGKNLTNILTAPEQYQPTFANPNAWRAIKDRKTAIAAAAKGPGIIDMATKSITNPSLQREAAKFVGGRTDFQGESQKPYMKPDDVTRGKNHNFFGWFYDAKLPKPAAVPKMVSSQSNTPTTNNSSKSAESSSWIENLMKIPGKIMGRRRGGVVKPTDGIKNPHSSVDTRILPIIDRIGQYGGINALEPGEGIVRKSAMENGGKSIVESLNNTGGMSLNLNQTLSSPIINRPTTNYNISQSPTLPILSRNQKRKSPTINPPVRPKPIVSGVTGGTNRSPVTSGSRPAGNTPPVRATSGSSQSRQSARQLSINR